MTAFMLCLSFPTFAVQPDYAQDKHVKRKILERPAKIVLISDVEGNAILVFHSDLGHVEVCVRQNGMVVQQSACDIVSGNVIVLGGDAKGERIVEVYKNGTLMYQNIVF